MSTNKQNQIRRGYWPASKRATMKEQEPIPVMPPSKLGEYTVIQEIAEGTFGKVKSVYLISLL
jgi:hypothetical protein